MTDIVEDLGDLPPRSRVEALSGFGLTADEIAHVLDVEVGRLKAAFGKELGSGHLKANAKVAENLYRKATGDGREAVTAAIFWLKTRARWKETSVHEIADERRSSDLTTWTDEMLLSVIEGLQRDMVEAEEKETAALGSTNARS